MSRKEPEAASGGSGFPGKGEVDTRRVLFSSFL